MIAADTPMPGEDPGALPEDQRESEPDPTTEMDVEGNPHPEPDSSLPPEVDSEVEDTEQQPT